MNRILKSILNRWRKLSKFLKIGILAVVVILIIWALIPGGKSDLPTAKVGFGEFIIDLRETGKLRAENSVTVTSPAVRISLQVIDLIPEGTVVKEGDFLMQFDSTELKASIDDRLAEFDIARSNLVRSLASMDSRMASLESAVENSHASHRLAELSLEQMQFEADKRIEQGKLSLRQAEIALKQAEQQVKAQRVIDSADIRSLELKIKQAKIELQRGYRDLSQLRINAPSPGLVIYKEFWKGGEMAKLALGDRPWRGQGMIELPDLSIMMVETSVSEVDFSKVKEGQEVEIKLDAYPEPTFYGKVANVAVLASEEEGISEAKIFEILIRIDGEDPLLRPGMSAAARIIVDRIPDQLWVPIEAVFERNGEKIVWEAAGSGFKVRPVELGERNDNFVVIKSGIDRNDMVALVDPTLSEDERLVIEKSMSEAVQNGANDQKNTKPPRRSRRSRRH
ncbi:efflux RND transporter periplasmic adaptor subunit [bacterium]|nr:efflux RND transporter periplasmic adaptor subunit [bacterium]